MNLEELKKYEWISFYDCRTNVKDKKSGAKIGRYLVISGYQDRWRIYQIYGGLPIVDVWITSLEDAAKIAIKIDSVYGEYLGIWEIWQDVNVIEIARLSIPDGEKICNVLHELERLNRPINYNDFQQLLEKK